MRYNKDCKHLKETSYRKMLGGEIYEIILCKDCNKYLGQRPASGIQRVPEAIVAKKTICRCKKTIHRAEPVNEIVERLTSYAQDGVG